MARGNTSGASQASGAEPTDNEQASISVDHTKQASTSSDTSEVTIYPLRSYLDGKEIRRAGGEGYMSPKHDAVSLIAAGLATDKNPKA